MFGLKSLPRLRSLSSKFLPSVRSYGSYIKFGDRYIHLNSKPFVKAFEGIFCASFAGLFAANTCIGAYETTVIEKPFGDNCPLRNGLVGLGGGIIYGLVKGITYSFCNVFFWANAWYEHKYSNIVQTKFGRMRERDIRFHLIPGATKIKKSVTSNDNIISQDTRNCAKLLENLGVLNYDRRSSYDGY